MEYSSISLTLSFLISDTKKYILSKMPSSLEQHFPNCFVVSSYLRWGWESAGRIWKMLLPLFFSSRVTESCVMMALTSPWLRNLFNNVVTLHQAFLKCRRICNLKHLLVINFADGQLLSWEEFWGTWCGKYFFRFLRWLSYLRWRTQNSISDFQMTLLQYPCHWRRQ